MKQGPSSGKTEEAPDLTLVFETLTLVLYNSAALGVLGEYLTTLDPNILIDKRGINHIPFLT